MVRNPETQCVIAAVLFAIILPGCQTSNNKWATAWKERTKPKPKFQGIEGEEEVTYWPYKADKSRKKQTPMPDEIKEKFARKNEQKKRDTQLSELLSKGDQLRVGGQIEDARVAYSQALQIEPDNASIHHRLAIVADKQRQFTVADEHYQAALKVRPRDVNLLSDLGYSLSMRGNYQQAEATLKKALEIDHSHQGAMANLGDIYAKQNRREDALAMFRAGAPEGAAQSYMAKLFSDDRSGDTPASDGDWGNSHSNPVVASNDAPLDYKNMSLDQIRAEMGRRGQEAKTRRQRADQAELARTRESSAGEELARQERSQMANEHAAVPNRNQYEAQQANASRIDDDWGSPAANSLAANNQRQSVRTNGSDNLNGGWSQQPIEIVRGNPAQAQTARQQELSAQYAYQRNAQNGGQQQAGAYGSNAPANNGPDGNAGLSASQYAAQLAMSVGPGSMFPVVPSAADIDTPSGDTGAYNQRFGGEFQQAPAYQNSQNWGGNSIEQTSAADNAPIEGAPAISPNSPTSNWGSPSGRRLSWQNDNATTADWANESPNSGAAGTGLDSGAGRSLRSQSNDGRRVAFNQMESDWQSQGQQQSSGNDATRPFNGSWPNSNSLPSRQTQKPITNARDYDANNGNMQYGSGSDGANAPANAGTSNSNSLPMWKYAPNR